jgi:hypothetical protein
MHILYSSLRAPPTLRLSLAQLPLAAMRSLQRRGKGRKELSVGEEASVYLAAVMKSLVRCFISQ